MEALCQWQKHIVNLKMKLDLGEIYDEWANTLKEEELQ